MSLSCIYISAGCFLSSELLKKKFILLLEIYLLKGEKLLSEEMIIVFTELLLSGGMKRAITIMRKSEG